LWVFRLIIAVSPLSSSAGEVGQSLPANPYAHDPQLSCGPRCAAFLFSYFGRECDYAGILEECAPGPLGTTLEQVRGLVEGHGLSTCCFSGATTGKLKRLRCPAIVHLTQTGGGPGHFLVLVGWSSEKEAFHVYSPPSFYGLKREEELAGRLSGLGLAISDKPLPAADELLRSEDSLWPSWLALLLTSSLLIWIAKPQWFSRQRQSRRGGVGEGDETPNAINASSTHTALLLCLVVLGGCSAGCSSSDAGANDREIDRGRVIAGPSLRSTFRVQNRSASAFRIKSVRRACACQHVTFDKEHAVAPGDYANVSVEAPTTGREGPQSYHFVLQTDASEEGWKEIPLVLKAQVAARIKAIPSQIALGVTAGKPASASLVVVSSECNVRDRFRRMELEQHSGSVSVNERPNAPRGTMEYEVTVSADAPIGDINAKVVLTFDDNEVPRIEVPVVGRVEGDIYPVPRVLRMSPNEDTRPVVGVMSRSKLPFSITEVKTGHGLCVERESEEGDFSHRYSVSMRDALRPGKYLIRFTTDQPFQKTITLPVVVQ
jgi:hypothetical protein